MNKFSNWLKGIAFTALLIIALAGSEREELNAVSGKDLDDGFKRDGITAQGLQEALIMQGNAETERRLRNDMDIHTALLFYCAPKISRRISDFTSADGHFLVRENPDDFIVWQADEQKQDTLKKILTLRDPESKTQVCATFNPATKDLVFHLGGTDITSFYDFLCAGTAALEGLSPRAPDGVKYADSVIVIMKDRYADAVSEGIHVSIVAHSQGSVVAPGMMAALMNAGFSVDKVFLIDPFGAREAFDRTADILGLPCPSRLEKNVTSYKSSKKGFFDAFKYASASVGTEEVTPTKSHGARDFIEVHNAQRWQKSNLALTRQP